MMFITLQSLPGFITFKSPSISGKEDTERENWIPRLKSRQVPLIQWASQVLVHTTGSLLNNWAFAFNVPLTVLIVFRSAGELNGNCHSGGILTMFWCKGLLSL